MTIVVDTKPSRATRARWAKAEAVGLDHELELDALELTVPGNPRAGLDALGALTGIDVEQTIEAAPVVKLTLRDPNMRLLSEAAGRVRPAKAKGKGVDPVAVDAGWEPIAAPSLVGESMELTLDGVTFRLTAMSYSSATGEASLTFEHRLVYWLRRKRGARRASRGSCTRAQFVLALVREVRTVRYRFVCPELNVKQTIAKSSSRGIRAALASTSSSSSTRATSSNDVPRVLDRVYPRHRIGAPGSARLSERQVRAAAELAGLSPTDALHAAQIAHGESDFYPGVVQDDPGDGNIGHGLWQMTPHAWGGPSSATYQHMQSLGGIDAMRNPIQAARQMKWMHDQANGWQPWYGTKYLDTSKRATGSVLANGVETDVSGTDEGGSASGSYRKSYQFAREANEDSWTAIQRLAQEVGWRFFVVGNSAYYMSELTLYGRRPRYELEPDDPAVLDLSYDIDWGKPVSECSLEVVLERWDAPPGSVVLINGYGPPDGRWLVASVTRDYFAPVATVTLKQPGPAKREPAAETSSGSSDDSSSSSSSSASGGSGPQALYERAEAIDAKNYPYVWGGGHGTRGEPSRGTGRDPGVGYDCSGYVGACLLAGGYGGSDPAVHSSSMGSLPGAKPGRGRYFTVHYNSGHTYIVFEAGMNVRHKRADTSRMGEGGNAPQGPHLRNGPAYGAFSLCHFDEGD